MDSSDNLESEKENLCLMADHENGDEVNFISSYCSYDTLHDAFIELHDDSTRLATTLNKSCYLQNQVTALTKERLGLKKEIHCLEIKEANHKCENAEYEKQVNDLKDIVAKFTNGRDNLKVLLGNQKGVYD